MGSVKVNDIRWPSKGQDAMPKVICGLVLTYIMHNISMSVNASKLRGWKHDFLEKSVGGCTSYDVIAPWPDRGGGRIDPPAPLRVKNWEHHSEGVAHLSFMMRNQLRWQIYSPCKKVTFSTFIWFISTNYKYDNAFARVPMGYSRTLPADGGRYRPPLLTAELLHWKQIYTRFRCKHVFTVYPASHCFWVASQVYFAPNIRAILHLFLV